MAEEINMIQKFIELIKNKEGIVDTQETGEISEILFNLRDRYQSLKESKKQGITHIITIDLMGAKMTLEGNKKLVEDFKDVIPEKTYKRIMEGDK